MTKTYTRPPPARLRVRSFPQQRDLAILGCSAILITLCLAFAAGQIGIYQTLQAYAQEAPPESIDIQALLGQLQSTTLAISALITTAGSIAAGVVAWLRARFGDKVISDGANEWFQWFFEQLRSSDTELKNAIKEVVAKGAELQVVVDVARKAVPEFDKLYQENAPKALETLEKARQKVEEEWQPELDKIYEISPKADPVGS